jgi:outer membrane lipoprotein SlyB
MIHNNLARTSIVTALLALALGAQIAQAQTRVQYGRITAVTPTTVTDSTGRNVGTVVGGGIGLATGSGQSGSNRALRTAVGATAGRQVGNMATRAQAFEYTVLIGGTNTVRIVSDQAGKRVGDCVSIEQGQFANIRLVADSRCNPPPARAAAPAATPAPAPAPAAAPEPADVQAANACEQAKQQVLDAETDDAFSLAERRMRLLCGE